MPTFEEQKQRYMGGSGGGSIPSGGAPIPIHPGCQVLPQIHGRSYFPALKARINALGTNGVGEQFIYIAGWLLDPNFSLDGPGGGRLVDLLKAKAAAGVDVRVLGWVMAPEVLQNSMVQRQASGLLVLNSKTMGLINALRAEPALANKACLNILSHPAGAVHIKMALVGAPGQAVGFTGGIDFMQEAPASRHEATWHDVQAQVSGPALQGLYETYRQMWNEIRGRPTARLTSNGVTCDSHTSSTTDVPARTITGAAGTAHVQSLRTLPRFNFAPSISIGNTLGADLPTNRPLSYAPGGLFEVRQCWERAIGAARQYIYIEDQGFYSHEVFDWINAAVKANAELRVVLVTGRPDPSDDPGPNQKFFRVAVNNHLVRGLDSAQLDRVGVFGHRSKTIHTKSTIVDDVWAMIGSANCMRRSLYTDLEHSIAYMDEAGRAVGSYRMDLWGTHLQVSMPDAAGALNRWFGLPFLGAGTPGPIELDRLWLPLPATTLTAEEQTLYDQIYDADSRQSWGGPLVDLYMRQHGVGSLSP